MKTLLWLDDIRNPNDKCTEGTKSWVNTFSPIKAPFKVIWAKSYKEFIYWIDKNGLPDAICFDHDLADWAGPHKEMTGMDCAKWLVDYALDNNLALPLYNIQSSNPAGKANIAGLLTSYNKQYAKI